MGGDGREVLSSVLKLRAILTSYMLSRSISRDPLSKMESIEGGETPRIMDGKCPTIVACMIVLAAGCIVASSGCNRAPADQREESFAGMVADTVGIEVPLNQGLKLVPGSPQFYAPDGLVSFFVYNRTGHDLVFADNIFGAQGFVFNDEVAGWEEVDLGFTPVVPESRRLRNGTTEHNETLAGFFTDRLEEYGEIRLLVIGYAEDTPVVEVYGAYADIKIVKGSDPDVVLVTLTPSPVP
jgi:hypothetical protein